MWFLHFAYLLVGTIINMKTTSINFVLLLFMLLTLGCKGQQNEIKRITPIEKEIIPITKTFEQYKRFFYNSIILSEDEAKAMTPIGYFIHYDSLRNIGFNFTHLPKLNNNLPFNEINGYSVNSDNEFGYFYEPKYKLLFKIFDYDYLSSPVLLTDSLFTPFNLLGINFKPKVPLSYYVQQLENYTVSSINDNRILLIYRGKFKYTYPKGNPPPLKESLKAAEISKPILYVISKPYDEAFVYRFAKKDRPNLQLFDKIKIDAIVIQGTTNNLTNNPEILDKAEIEKRRTKSLYKYLLKKVKNQKQSFKPKVFVGPAVDVEIINN